MGGYPVAGRLADLPWSRQWGLLWSAGWLRERLLAHPDDLTGLGGCDPWLRHSPSTTAHIDPAGRYHLDPDCNRTCRDETGPWGAAVLPHTVPVGLRCAAAAQHWAGYAVADSSSRVVQIRYQLVEAFGVLCQACGHDPARELDHDHYTGLVRGYLCRRCNNRVDACVHLSGCHLAVYLEAPPALPWRIEHPDHRVKMRRSGYRARCEVMARHGFAPPWWKQEQ